MTAACPCCGRAYPKPKAARPDVTVANLSDRDMFAYYKRTAPVEDVRFQLRLALPEAIRTGYQALLAQLEQLNGKATPATVSEYKRLQQASRTHNLHAERVRRPLGNSGWTSAA
jgi:hypothetical protein